MGSAFYKWRHKCEQVAWFLERRWPSRLWSTCQACRPRSKLWHSVFILGATFLGSPLKPRGVRAFTGDKLEYRRDRLLQMTLCDHLGVGMCCLVVLAFKLAGLSRSVYLLMELCSYLDPTNSPGCPHCPINAPKGIYSLLLPPSVLAEENKNKTCGQGQCCQAWSIAELLLQFILPNVLFVCRKTDKECLTVA